MKPLPIRRQVALWTVALTAAVVLLFAAGTLFNLHDEQLEAVDVELHQDELLLRELVDETPLQEAIDSINRDHPWLTIVRLPAESAPESTAKPPLPATLITAAAPHRGGPTTLKQSGHAWRITVNRDREPALLLAYDLVEVNEMITDLIEAYLLSLPVVLVAVGFGAWWVAGRALAPVGRLTRAIESVQAVNLSDRVAVPRADDELRRLAQGFNEMLARLESAFAQSQRFAADASHELRTPLTVMRGEVERWLRDDALAPAQAAQLLSLQEEISHLERITETLLLLAAFDAGREALPRAAVNLSALTREACADAEILAEAEGITLHCDIADALFVKGDASHLRRLLLNVLQNAIRHNHAGGTAWLSLADQSAVSAVPGICVRVSNTGPGIPADLRDRIFERFFQVDASRGERRGHGLGLSLCREIARAHEGTFELNPAAPADRTEFLLTLPGVTR